MVAIMESEQNESLFADSCFQRSINGTTNSHRLRRVSLNSTDAMSVPACCSALPPIKHGMASITESRI